jgi:hypothetical protein
MIFFKGPSVVRILRGEKTQARKLWDRPRAKEGAEHLVYRRPPMTGEKPFAKLLITRVWKQKLGDMTEAEARAEGWPDKAAFLEQFTEGRRFKVPLDQVEVYALEFRVIERYEESPAAP